MKNFAPKFSVIKNSPLGGSVDIGSDPASYLDYLQEHPQFLIENLNRHDGLLLIKNIHEISARPELLLELSHQFGSEVEGETTQWTARPMC